MLITTITRQSGTGGSVGGPPRFFSGRLRRLSQPCLIDACMERVKKCRANFFQPKTGCLLGDYEGRAWE